MKARAGATAGCIAFAVLVMGVISSATLAGDISVSGGSVLSTGNLTTTGNSMITGAGSSAGEYIVSAGDTIINAAGQTVTIEDTGTAGETGALVVAGVFKNEGATTLNGNGAGGGVIDVKTNGSVINSGTFSMGADTTMYIRAGGEFVNNNGGILNFTGGNVVLDGSSSGYASLIDNNNGNFTIGTNASFTLKNEYATLQTYAANVVIDGSVIGSGGVFAINTTSSITINGTAGSDDSGYFYIEGNALTWKSGSTIQLGYDSVENELAWISTGRSNVTIEDGTKIGMTSNLADKFRDVPGFGDVMMYVSTTGGSIDVQWAADAPGGNTYTITNGLGTFVVTKAQDDDGDDYLWLGTSALNDNTKSDYMNTFLTAEADSSMGGILGLSNVADTARQVGSMSDTAISSLPDAGGQANAYALKFLSGNGGAGLMNSSQIVSALTSYTGLSATLSSDVAMSTGRAATANVQGRIGAIRNQYAQAYESVGSGNALASAMMNCNYRNRVWVSGFGLWEDLDEKNGIPGYRYNSGGVMAGYDRAFGPVVVGASFGYTGGSFKDRSAIGNDSDIDSYAFNLYSVYTLPNGLFASLFGGYMYSDYDMKKYRGGFDNMNTPVNGWERSDYHANTWSIGGEFGYDFKPTDRLTLTPSVGLSYAYSRTNSFAAVFDWGAGSSAIRHSQIKNHSLSLPVNLAAEYLAYRCDDASLSLQANVGYAYEFHNNGASGTLALGGVNAPRIDFRGRAPGRNTWNIGAGAKYSHGRFEVAAKYDYYTRSEYDAHRVMATFGVNF